LSYRGVAVGDIIEDTKAAMDALATRDDASEPVTAIVNYEQMMALRRIAGRRDLESLS